MGRRSLQPAVQAVTDGLGRIFGMIVFEAGPHHADARAVQVQSLAHTGGDAFGRLVGAKRWLHVLPIGKGARLTIAAFYGAIRKTVYFVTRNSTLPVL